MRHKKQTILCCLYAGCFCLSIVDAKTTTTACRQAIELCIYTVIPSLFPFIIIISLLNSTLVHLRPRLIRWFGKQIGIPDGAEHIVPLAVLGGYPVGAQVIAEGYRTGNLTQATAQRLMGFCNNAGPAFIFGMISKLFADLRTSCYIWLIHIISAAAVGMILPKPLTAPCTATKKAMTNISKILETTIKTTTVVCGWVIIFRIIIAFADKFVLMHFPQSTATFIKGILELTNGCIESSSIPCEGARFIYISTILAFGGICVMGQTASVSKDLGLGFYFPGKILQTSISLIFSSCFQFVLFPKSQQASISIPAFGAILIILILFSIFLILKKTVAFSENNMYNKKNTL